MKITKENYDAMPESMKAAFTQIEGTEDYSNGEENASALKSALDKEKAAKVKAAQERDALKKSNDEETQKQIDAALEKARKDGDHSAIEKDYQDRLASQKAEIDMMKANASAQTIDAAHSKVVADIAKISTVPAVMATYANTRLKTEIGEDGSAITRVLDENGVATAATIDELKKEILDNSDFKSIISAGKGSGGGATGAKTDGGGSTSTQEGNFSDASVDDRVARLTEKMEAGE